MLTIQTWEDAWVYISAKVDYAIRALCGLAGSERAVTSAALATNQGLPANFPGADPDRPPPDEVRPQPTRARWWLPPQPAGIRDPVGRCDSITGGPTR